MLSGGDGASGDAESYSRAGLGDHGKDRLSHRLVVLVEVRPVVLQGQATKLVRPTGMAKYWLSRICVGAQPECRGLTEGSQSEVAKLLRERSRHSRRTSTRRERSPDQFANRDHWPNATKPVVARTRRPAENPEAPRAALAARGARSERTGKSLARTAVRCEHSARVLILCIVAGAGAPPAAPRNVVGASAGELDAANIARVYGLDSVR